MIHVIAIPVAVMLAMEVRILFMVCVLSCPSCSVDSFYTPIAWVVLNDINRNVIVPHHQLYFARIRFIRLTCSGFVSGAWNPFRRKALSQRDCWVFLAHHNLILQQVIAAKRCRTIAHGLQCYLMLRESSCHFVLPK